MSRMRLWGLVLFTLFALVMFGGTLGSTVERIHGGRDWLRLENITLLATSLMVLTVMGVKPRCFSPGIKAPRLSEDAIFKRFAHA